jgi:outer membrane protein, multidrug efflux system
MADVQVVLATELGLAYIDLRSSQARLALAQASADSQQQTLQIVDWRLQAGLVTALEQDQARAALAQTRAQLPLLRKRIEQGAHALAVLTGQPSAALRAELLAAPATPLPQPAAELALSLPADTLRQRADVQAAAWELEAAWQRVAQADAARRPSLRLSGTLGLNALTLGTLTSSGALAAGVLASLAWPLWDGGAATAQVAVQQAAWDSARASYRATVLAALQAVEDALVALRDDRLRLLQLQQAALAATRAATLAAQRFNSGLVDYAAVLETQRSAFSAQDGVASAQADVSADHLRLFQALGGGWRATEAGDEAPAPEPRQGWR